MKIKISVCLVIMGFVILHSSFSQSSENYNSFSKTSKATIYAGDLATTTQFQLKSISFEISNYSAANQLLGNGILIFKYILLFTVIGGVTAFLISGLSITNDGQNFS